MFSSLNNVLGHETLETRPSEFRVHPERVTKIIGKKGEKKYLETGILQYLETGILQYFSHLRGFNSSAVDRCLRLMLSL